MIPERPARRDLFVGHERHRRDRLGSVTRLALLLEDRGWSAQTAPLQYDAAVNGHSPDGAVVLRFKRAPLLGALLAALSALAPSAQEPEHILADYSLTSWTTKDGLAGTVWALAQDADGYLWLGTGSGLVRFDGARFSTWDPFGGSPLPEGSVRALWAGADGSLWVGYGEAGVICRIQGSHVSVFDEGAGLAEGAVADFAQDRSGRLWAATAAGLFHHADGQWHRAGPASGLPEGPANSIEVSRAGTLYVGTPVGVFSQPEGTPVFSRIDGSPATVRSLTEDTSGVMWVSDALIGFRRLVEPAGLGDSRPGRGYRVLHDRRGDLWVGTLGQGLWRIRHAETGARMLETTTVRTGLSSDGIRSLLEDRDGNIWAGTSEGLNRLTPHRVTPVLSLGLVRAIDVTREGRVWVGTAEEVIRFSETNGVWHTDQPNVPMPGVRTLYADVDGSAIVATDEGLWRIVDQRVSPLPLSGGQARIRVDAIAADYRGGLWIADREAGLAHWRDGHLRRVEIPLGDAEGRILSAYSDRSGRLWLAVTGSRLIGLMDDGASHEFTTADGLGAGPYGAFFEDLNGVVWVGGSGSLSWFSRGRFHHIDRDNGFPAGAITAVIEDDERHIWAGTPSGLVRIARSEFEDAADHSAYQLRFRVFNLYDGLAGLPVGVGTRSAIRAGDSRLWFTTSGGLTIVDPRRLGQPRLPAPVRIETVAADDARVNPAEGGLFPAGTRRVLIEYTAPLLTSPFKTRFRYRLDGFDADWIDAGMRRQAVYTNLPPRRYAFEVAASDEDGVWSESGAAFTFTIRPFFYQTPWFWTMVVLFIGALGWSVWQARVRQMRRQFALVLDERVRLSHELHDTLLQSLVGVALQFGAVSNSLESSPETARARLARARRQIEEYIRDARQSIWNLRSPMLETRDLIAALRESADRMSTGRPVQVDVNVRGTPLRVTPEVEHQLLRIGQEAILNAVRHSGARAVQVSLDYGDHDITLRVSDDGCGFDASGHAGAQDGHYGLTTMRERALQVGGECAISSIPGRGTIVEAHVPVTPAAKGQAAG